MEKLLLISSNFITDKLFHEVEDDVQAKNKAG